MNSLTMYEEFCQNVQSEPLSTRLEHIDKLVKRVHMEITSEPYDVGCSTLFTEIRKASLKEKASVSAIDAYIITEILWNRMNDNDQPIESLKFVKDMPGSILKKGARLNAMLLNPKMKETNSRLSEIQLTVESMRPAEQEEAMEEPAAPAPEEPEEEYAAPAPEEPEEEPAAPAPEEPEEEPTAPAPEEPEEEPAASAPEEPEEDLAAPETGATSDRAHTRAADIEKWHGTLRNAVDALSALHPVLSAVLERMNALAENTDEAYLADCLSDIRSKVGAMLLMTVSFADAFTEDCTLQFARMQVELYNLIADNYEYHGNAASRSADADYKNAASNYAEFLSVIADHLAVFGIETIQSEQGTPFSGTIHESISNGSFDPKTAVVQESLRAGFKYGDCIIQKEKIAL